MVTHDVQEAFKLGTRLLVFDKIRHDPHDPSAYGATVTYDIPLSGSHSNIPVEALQGLGSAIAQESQPLSGE
jgi:NitT/TauT family transport system ATP-binding protein